MANNTTNSTSGNLGKATFLNGPKNDLKVAGLYEKSGLKDVVNSIQEKGKEYGINFSEIVKGGKDLAKLWPIVKDIQGGGDAGDILNRLMANSGKIGELAKPLLNKLPEGFTTSASNLYNEYKDTIVKVGNVARTVASSDLSSIDGIAKMVNKISGDPNGLFIEDQDGIAAFTVGLIHDATKYGVPNSFDAVANTIENSDLMMKVCNGVLPIAVEAGDIRMLRSINQKMGQGNLLSVAPGILSDFNERYSSPLLQDTQELLGDFNVLMETYKEINVDWKYRARVSNETGTTDNILNGMVLVDSSEDMKTLFEAGAVASPEGTEEKLLLIAQGRESNVYMDLRRMLPLTQLLPVQQITGMN